MTKKNSVLCWFRKDLRTIDNPAFRAACQQGSVLPIFIFDEKNYKQPLGLGKNSAWWLKKSLLSLNKSLEGMLNFYQGDALEIIEKIVKTNKVEKIFFNRCYEPAFMALDKKIENFAKENNLEIETFNASLLWEPSEILNSSGEPYKVFTPFYKKGCLQAASPRDLVGVVKNPSFSKDLSKLSQKIDDAEFVKNDQKNHHDLEKIWNPGANHGLARLNDFVKNNLSNYHKNRDFPGVDGCSRLSPYLHFGEISPNQAFFAANKHGSGKGLEVFLTELAWREFCAYQLYYFPKLDRKNFHEKFDNFPWLDDKESFNAWKMGQTGVPIVDAGMRELYQTGYMHNRVRMIVASFLVKNLLIDWKEGEKWFWSQLVDADLASNSANWQWVAGSGADAAPYFRIFNPVLQGKKFDSDGRYTRAFVPELSKLPDKYLFEPSKAPKEVLLEAGVVLGKSYPWPIVDLAKSRSRALTAYKKIS